jgi:hypothetical protein
MVELEHIKYFGFWVRAVNNVQDQMASPIARLVRSILLSMPSSVSRIPAVSIRQRECPMSMECKRVFWWYRDMSHNRNILFD